MKRFVITPKIKGEYRIPILRTLEFTTPKKWGSYCSETGELFASLDDGKTIFENEDTAKVKLAEIIHTLFEETL